MTQIERLIRFLHDLRHTSFTSQGELSGNGMMIGVGTCLALFIAGRIFLPRFRRF